MQLAYTENIGGTSGSVTVRKTSLVSDENDVYARRNVERQRRVSENPRAVTSSW